MAKFAKATTNMFRQVKTKWAGGKSRIQNKYRLGIPALIAIQRLELCHLRLQSRQHNKSAKLWIITNEKEKCRDTTWLYLVCNVVWEPVQSLVQPFTRSGACALDIPAMSDLDSQLPRGWVDCWEKRVSDCNKLLAYQWRWRREWRPSLSVISAAFIAFGRSCLFANTSSTASLNSSCKCNKKYCYQRSCKGDKSNYSMYISATFHGFTCTGLILLILVQCGAVWYLIQHPV